MGSVLTYVRGKIYLAGPYKGAPFSVAAIVAGRRLRRGQARQPLQHQQVRLRRPLGGTRVNIELEPEQVARNIDELGFGFMFAPRHHKAMAQVVPMRKELVVRTIFNFLGPLTNPAGANHQLLWPDPLKSVRLI
ncbi:MAG TPA: hypothetical protein VN752_07145 [Solirubrobacterales bacterium]|nr:hypothetical protein [Solirubrobacterales bacterium]